MANRYIEELIADFAEAVVAQDRCIRRGDAREGNRHAKRYIAAARKLLAGG
jgi:hypothetical protein